MTDSNFLCFKKQVKNNIAGFLWFILTAIILFWPIAITFIWMSSLPHATSTMQMFENLNDGVCGFIGIIFNVLWIIIFAIPFLKCYIENMENKMGKGRND